jgi:glycosyltransferase involved in cell wall biosynthesis
MKIAYLSTFYPFRGGIAQFNASLYREFEKRDDIKAFTFKRQYPNLLFPGKSQMVQPGDPADKIPSIRTLDTANPLTYISSSRAIAKYKPGLLLSKFWMPFFAPSLGYVSASLRKNLNTKSISILDNVIPHEKRPGDISLIKYYLNRCDGFITMSSTVRNDLLQLKPDAKYLNLEHPLYDHFGDKVDKQKALDKLNLPKGKKYILFFGFIRGYKGLDNLIEALALMPEDYHLIIAGECYGKYDAYQAQIDRLKLNDRITQFVRYIPDEEAPLFFSAADLCVLPYKSATQSGIVGISYHFDLPVLATDTGSLREMIQDKNCGEIVDKGDPKSLADSIVSYFNKDLGAKYIENIKAYKLLSSWANFADGIRDFYTDICKQTKF